MLRIYARLNQKTAIQFLDYVLEKLPFRVEVIQTDNGAEFQGAVPLARPRPRDRPRLHQAARRRGSTARSSDPTASTPRSSTGCSTASCIDDTELFNDKLQEWEDFYNFHRPHGGLGGQTPYERLRQKTTTPGRKRPSSVAHRRAPGGFEPPAF